jgi:hypothetical protein
VSYFSEVLADNPVHYWRMSDPAGSSGAIDQGSSPTILFPNMNAWVLQSTQILQGQFFGGSPFGWAGVTGDGGGAFLGGNPINYENARSGFFNPEVPFSTPGSLEFWCLLQDSFFGQFFGWFARLGAAGQQLFGLSKSYSSMQPFLFASSGGSPFAAVTGNKYHHYVLTWTTSLASLYFDGGAAGTRTVSLTAGTSTDVDWLVGAGAIGAGNLRSSGLVTELAIYGSAISSGRVSAHFGAAELRTHAPTFLGSTASVSVPKPIGTTDVINHAGLTTTGEIILTAFDAIRVTLTTIPASYGVSNLDPLFYFGLGFVTVITANGVSADYALNRAQQWFELGDLATAVSWSLAPGVVATITEQSFVF